MVAVVGRRRGGGNKEGRVHDKLAQMVMGLFLIILSTDSKQKVYIRRIRERNP